MATFLKSIQSTTHQPSTATQYDFIFSLWWDGGAPGVLGWKHQLKKLHYMAIDHAIVKYGNLQSLRTKPCEGLLTALPEVRLLDLGQDDQRAVLPEDCEGKRLLGDGQLCVGLQALPNRSSHT